MFFNRTAKPRPASLLTIALHAILIGQLLVPPQQLIACHTDPNPPTEEEKIKLDKFVVTSGLSEEQEAQLEADYEFRDWIIDWLSNSTNLGFYSPDSEGEGTDDDECGINPVDPRSGNVRRKIPDLQSMGSLSWNRIHNSTLRSSFNQQSRLFGTAGDWRHSHQFDLVRVTPRPGVVDFQFTYPSGNRVGLLVNQSGKFSAQDNGPETVEIVSTSSIEVRAKDGLVIRFSPTKNDDTYTWYRPESAQYPNGSIITYEYAADGKLTRMADSLGQSIALAYRDYDLSTRPWKRAARFDLQTNTTAVQEFTIPVARRGTASDLQLTISAAAQISELRFLNDRGEAIKLGPTELTDGNPLSSLKGRAIKYLSWPQSAGTLVGIRAWVAADCPASTDAHLVVDIRETSAATAAISAVSTVTTSLGQKAEYDYKVTSQYVGQQLALTTVRYGDDTEAHYTYSKTEDGYGQHAYLVSADDPRYNGPAKRIRYTYGKPSQGGIIKSEVNMATGKPWFTLERDPAKPLQRRAVYSDDRVVTYNFDSSGRTADKTDSIGRKVQYSYNGIGSENYTKTDHRGRRTERVTEERVRREANHDIRVREERFTDPRGKISTRERDEQGRTACIIDKRGREARIERDTQGRVTKTTRSDGATDTIERDAKGRPTRVTTPEGSRAYTYDANNFLSSITSENGQTKRIVRDVQKRTIAVTLPSGATTLTAYNDRGKPIKHADTLGRVRTYSYDTYGRKIAETDPEGRTATYAYDELDRMTRQTDFQGRTTSMEYAELPNSCSSCTLSSKPTRVTGPDGIVTEFLYDTAGRLLSLTIAPGTPAQATTTYTYCDDDNLLTVTDPLGRVTRHTYDDDKHRLTTTDPLGRLTKWTYDTDGRMISETAPDGGLTRHTSVTDATGAITKWTYDLAGNLTSETDALGRVTKHTYDGKRRTLTKFPDGKTHTWDYDTAGRVIKETNRDSLVTTRRFTPTGLLESETRTPSPLVPGLSLTTTSYTYDANGRLLTTTDPLGRITRRAYDTLGNLTLLTAPGGRSTANTYDAQGRILTTTDAAGLTTRTTYDPAGNLLTLTDARGSTTRFTYDALRRKTSMVYPDNTTETWTYDRAGQQLTYVNRSGQTKTITYNALGQPLRATWSNPSSPSPLALSPLPALPSPTAYTYDPAGRLISIANSSAILTYTHDPRGRLASETTNLSALAPGLAAHTVSYGYDPLGRMNALTYPGNATVNYSYDARSRLTDISEGTGHPLATYRYDALGRIVTLERENGIDTAYTYNPAGQLTSIAHNKADTTLASAAYTLDLAGRRTAQTREDNKTETYTYDPTSQLTSVDYGTGQKETYAYDATGNRTATTAVSPIANRPLPLASGTAAYTANNLNQYTQVTHNPSPITHDLRYDANGNLLTYSEVGTSGPLVRALSYDSQNRLIAVETATTRAEFFYDARNRCILRKYYTRATNGTWTLNPTESRAHTYDLRWNLLTERNLAGATQATYLHGQRTDEILVAKLGATTVYPIADGLGSTVALTDTKGKVTERYRYTAYGQPTRLTATYNPSPITNNPYRFLFTGREWLNGVQLNDHRHRYYSPSLGRWTSTDPIGFAGGTNLYKYVGNAASILRDPLGLCCEDEQTAISNARELIDINLNYASTYVTKITELTAAVVDDYIDLSNLATGYFAVNTGFHVSQSGPASGWGGVGKLIAVLTSGSAVYQKAAELNQAIQENYGELQTYQQLFNSVLTSLQDQADRYAALVTAHNMCIERNKDRKPNCPCL